MDDFAQPRKDGGRCSSSSSSGASEHGVRAENSVFNAIASNIDQSMKWCRVVEIMEELVRLVRVERRM